MLNLDHIIKPKRLSENLSAILLKDHIVLDFNVSSVIFESNTGYVNPTMINQKSLFAEELEVAVEIDEKYDYSFLNKLSFLDCSINASDSVLFSSIAASGEDEFFITNLEIDPHKLHLDVFGLTYKVSCTSKKIRDNNTFRSTLDYNCMYYLFQMFKSLSGKKISKLLFCSYENNSYFTNEERSFYIAVNQQSEIQKFKSNVVKSIDFSELKDATQLDKKSIIETLCSTHKHLLRPCGDIVFQSKNPNFTQLSHGDYILWLTKKK